LVDLIPLVLGGLPGSLIKWFLHAMGTQVLTELTLPQEKHKASAVVWLGFSPISGETHYFKGELTSF
jgi:inosine/xanthosine triphosphate pyrophosphatase family protein